MTKCPRPGFVRAHENKITVIFPNLNYLYVYDMCKNTWSITDGLIWDVDPSFKCNMPLVAFDVAGNEKNVLIGQADLGWVGNHRNFYNSCSLFKLHND